MGSHMAGDPMPVRAPWGPVLSWGLQFCLIATMVALWACALVLGPTHCPRAAHLAGTPCATTSGLGDDVVVACVIGRPLVAMCRVLYSPRALDSGLVMVGPNHAVCTARLPRHLTASSGIMIP
jgi:hypothetical protein